MSTSTAASTDERDERRLTSIRGTEYLGSHPSAPSSLTGVDIVFTSAGVRFERRREMLGVRSWADVVRLDVDGSVTKRRAGFLRVFVFGLVGWLFPIRTDTALVRIETTDGPWVFGVDDLSIDELRRGLAQLDPYHR